MKTNMRKAVAVLLLLAAACSSSEPGEDDTDGDPTGPGGGGEFFMRATLDGAWAAETSFAASAGLGVYTIGGTKATGSNPYALSISLYNIGVTGTYPLGVGSTVAGGAAVLTNAITGTSSWITPLSGADGSITITTLTTTRIGGTFNFTATSIGGGATGTKTATGGEFLVQLAVPASGNPLPDNYGSKAAATIAGAAWNAASASGSYFAANRVVSVQASNNARVLTISLNEVTGPGTFPLGGARIMSVSNISQTPANAWHSAAAGSSGTVTISSITATRMRGTFSAMLGPTPGTSTTGTLTITNGSFDVGLGAPPE